MFAMDLWHKDYCVQTLKEEGHSAELVGMYAGLDDYFGTFCVNTWKEKDLILPMKSAWLCGWQRLWPVASSHHACFVVQLGPSAV